MKKRFPADLLIPILIGVALLTYIVVRAIVIPITHDEANTCLTFSVTSFWDIVTYEDPIPNNHIINTLLVKLFSNIFGMTQFVVRLPNILGFILYYAVILTWLRRINKQLFFVVTGIVLFTCNPYLIDFFSLARGYALSIAFMITSAYFAWRFIQDQQLKHHLYAIIWGAVAVYTNFTILNYYVALCVILFITDMQQFWKTGRKSFYSSLLQLATVTIILALISFYPLYRMVSTDQFVHWGKDGFYTDTIYSLAQSSAYGINYFNFTPHVWANLFIYVFSILFLFGIVVLRQNKWKLCGHAFTFFIFLFTGTVVVNVLQFYLIGTPWLTTRTALFYYPLLMIALLFGISYLQLSWKSGYKVIASILILLGLVHFGRSLNFYSFFEWEYDADNSSVINEIDRSRQSADEVMTMDADWIYYPSLNFIIVTTNHGPIELRNFHFDIDSNSTSQFYYLGWKEFETIKNKYGIMKKYKGGARVLAKKKITE